MNKQPAGLINRFLSRLEAKESELLTWGVVDGGFSWEELLDEAYEVIQIENLDMEEECLVRALEDRKLLFRFSVGSDYIYRSRMAESVRLMSRLRQWFPSKTWDVSPNLVSDFRFSTRARGYPARNLSISDIKDRLGERQLLDAKVGDAIGLLLRTENGEDLKLAEFQAQSTEQILADMNNRRTRGVVISAGTGTGKTLAFYLPIMAHISALIQPDSFWTKCLAVYPRTELLKDQLAEVYYQARKLDSYLLEHHGRKLIIGAFFGSTPHEATQGNFTAGTWEKTTDGYLCPYFKCPQCDEALVWLNTDIEIRRERLNCRTATCAFLMDDDEIVLTRKRMMRTKPDVLFTTTETLNRQLSNTEYRQIFGVKAFRPPLALLLDEIHIYAGTDGAQVANLIRRWRHAVGEKVQITGLSATLKNAGEFFGNLVDLNSANITDVTASEELDYQSVEYQIALRGDPVSGTSLLSTTIQTLMLLRRILDPWDNGKSEGLYGRRVFAFTNSLDVTNRLFHSMLDAEGLDSYGNPRPNSSPLANLRRRFADDHRRRVYSGQSWAIAEEIGHSEGLGVPLKITRTSSQDSGVDKTADVIVATASLEVGFDDDEVGAVVQHKAPMDMASFLQRRGRAGRNREMRPWTAVVLSDYGRDRIAYQGYDLLFDPLLEPQSLPLSNRYVLRMQAVYAFLDWATDHMPNDVVPGSMWDDLSGPIKDLRTPWGRDSKLRQKRVGELVRQVLLQEDARKSLETFLAEALSITQQEVTAIMWEHPRPLMTSVLPTLLRRLESNWARINEDGSKSDNDYRARNPLPEFAPGALFSDLNLPEVSLNVPGTRGGYQETFTMAVSQAMREFAPGKVSRRFGIRYANENHWLAPIDLHSPWQDLPISQICSEYDEIGPFQITIGKVTKNIRCIRPWALDLVSPPSDILPSSNAILEWRTQILIRAKGFRGEVPENSPWKKVIPEVWFFTHNQQSPVEVRRFSVASEASLAFRNGTHADLRLGFVDGETGDTAGIGFTQEVDGILFRIQVPDDLLLNADSRNKSKIRSFRQAYFRHSISKDPVLSEMANKFQKDWLYQIYYSALVTKASIKQITLDEANSELRGETGFDQLKAVLKDVFQTLDAVESSDHTPLSTHPDASGQRVHDALLDILRNERVIQRLGDLAEVLWQEADEEWNAYGRDRIISTIGGALMEACFQLSPLVQDGGLYLDIEPNETPQTDESSVDIWITESSMGGVGVIEDLMRRFTSSPSTFFMLAEKSLGPSDYELVDVELHRILDLAKADQEIQLLLNNIRQPINLQAHKQAINDLRSSLVKLGITVNHSVISAISSRIARPGSSERTDRLLLLMVERWEEEEERLGVEIDARVFAYAASHHPAFTEELNKAIAGSGDSFWRFQTIYGLLWPKGNLIRCRNLTTYNPYTDQPETDRLILQDVLFSDQDWITVEDDDWHSDVVDSLASKGTVKIHAPFQNRNRLKQALVRLVSEPIEIGFMNLYPVVTGVEQDANGFYLRLDMSEAIR